MTPADHITAAEQALSRAADMGNAWSEGERIALALAGIGHALIAQAVELGAPHAAALTGGPSSG